MVGPEQHPNARDRPILTGKLAIPPVRPGTVARELLLARLDEALTTKLALVVAPAGWGKTTSLVAWAVHAAGATPSCRVAWITLDESDDDPHRFWCYVATALDRAGASVTDGVLSSLRVSSVDPIEFAVPQLLNDLTSDPGCQVLVLDDYQTVADRRIEESLEYFLTYLPPRVHVVLGSRFDPALPLARMRARGELVELRAADLRFTSTEAAELVSAVADVELDRQELDTLVHRTEGWAVGLKLTALTLRGDGEAKARVEQIRGDDRHIMDYLATEVLGHLPAEQRDFLLSASALDQVSGPLCDSALQRADSAAMLQALDRADLFLVPLDRQRAWYRFHRLFGDALRRELDGIAPSRASEVLRRASDWYWKHGHFEDAIRTRTAAGDLAATAELLLAAEDAFLDQGAVGTYLQLADALGEEARQADPRLAVSVAAAAGLSGQAERVSTLLDAAEPRIDDNVPPYPNWRRVAAVAAFLRATYGYAAVHEPATALEYARRAVELEDDPSLQGWALARLALGYALLGEGQAEEAVTVLRQARRQAGPLGLPVFTHLIISGLLMECLLIGGRQEEARAVLRDVSPAAEGFEQAVGGAAAPAVTIIRVVQGQIAYLDGDMPQARDRLVHATELARIAGHPVLLLRALTSLADAHLATGDRTAARAVLQEAREVVESWTVPPAAAQRVADAEARVGRGAARAARRQHRLAEELTDREVSILLKLQGPLTQREIARELYLSLNTVKGYTKSLYRKLGVATRLEAVDRARALGLI